MPAPTATPTAPTSRPAGDGPHYGQTCADAEQMLAALGAEVEELTKRLGVVTADRDAAAAAAASYAARLNQSLAAQPDASPAA
jgi:hypothetical protein